VDTNSPSTQIKIDLIDFRSDKLHESKGYAPSLDCDNPILMTCIGFKDCHSNDIYEKDVVRQEAGWAMNSGKTVPFFWYSDIKLRFDEDDMNHLRWLKNYNHTRPDKLEVIGNLLEHPDLENLL